MSEFKVGDPVKRIESVLPRDGITQGGEYVVSDVRDCEIKVAGNLLWFDADKFELGWGGSVSAIDPGYYQFPGGHEVRHISAHLTSFGGQALQYIARSTRLDGKNKGDTIENLRKAVKFLNWEIERILGDGS